MLTAEQLAQLFHETYEKLAPQFGYETRKETAIKWEDIPSDSPNKRLMIAVAGEILKVLSDDATAWDADMADMEQIRSEWQEYRNEGLGRAG